MATVTFTKTNSPQYIDLGGTSTISYKITNTNPERMTSATIADPIFTTAGVTTSNIQNATLLGNTLTVSLGTNGLASNASITVSINVTVAKTATPSSTAYNTTATGTFIIVTLPLPSTVIQTATGLLQVNSAVIVLTKTVSPNSANITAGSLVTYTIAITNNGNVSGSIPIGQFNDSWTSNGLANVQISTAGFALGSSSISNNVILTINPGSTLNLVYTGTAVVTN